jgi:predicted O-linked N-acetylglucosamine transferase (SPINDLY family)
MHDLTSSGVSAVDHWLTDPLLCPQETAELFVETPVRLPSFYLHMPPSAIDAPMPSAVAERRPVIFGCCNNPAKLNDAVLRLWAEVLKAAPASRLTFRYFQHFASEDGKAPIVAGLRRHGIDAHRLMFETGGTERDDQLRHLGSIDIALDPFPFNGATTTFEALWMGLPVVTLAGRRFVGRVAAAHLQLVGLGDLVAESPEEYVRIAAGLAAAPDRRARLRRELRSRVLASPLCDAHAYARSVERAYREMWRARCVGSVWDGNLLEG